MKVINFILSWLGFKKVPTYVHKEAAKEAPIESIERTDTDQNSTESKNTEALGKMTHKENNDEYSTPSFYPILLKTKVPKSKTTEACINREDKGIMEDYFHDFLARTFPGKIANNLKLQGLHYIPDYIYIDNENGFYIIIEVDEPYTLINGSLAAIHLKGSDDIRNTRFLNEGWNIIRFAEEQVATEPDECVKYIQQFLNSELTSNLPKIECWDKDQSNLMIQSLHRNSYLPFKLSDEIIRNQGNSCRNFHVLTAQLLKEQDSIILHLENSDSKTYECWIKRNQFIKIYQSSNLGRLLTKQGLAANELQILTFCMKLKITAIGKTNGRYFNYIQDSIIFQFDEYIIDLIKNRSSQGAASRFITRRIIN